MALHLASRGMLAGRALKPLVSAAPVQRCAVVRSAPALMTAHRRPAVLVRASADDDEEEGEKKEKKPKKKIPSPVKRVMLAEARRMYNKSRKSACATRIKKVIVFSQSKTSATATATAEDVTSVEKLVAEAYEEIDKAVTKGILHKNNAAHKKSRVAKYKRAVAMAAGLFTPTEDHQDYKKYLRMKEMQAKKQAAAASS